MRSNRLWLRVLILPAVLALLSAAARGQEPQDLAAYIKDQYVKRERMVPMRDGVQLYTAVFTPRDESKTYPILMRRTPYSCGPYGENEYPGVLGPSDAYAREGYIFVVQDVRGCYMSQGQFENMRPHRPAKAGPADIDESTDTYDTIEWLLHNVAGHNGRVGLHGISYPGFYAAAGMIAAHPALRAVSPQAPIADWWYDDFHHHGAFFLPHAFNFFASFGKPRPAPTTERGNGFDHGTPDGYQFFLDLGPLRNANERHFHGGIEFWNCFVEHHSYDAFWQARNLLPHLENVAPAVLTVGGWFDAEDLYGALQIYRAVEQRNPGVFNVIVMGPWRHGGWNRGEGEAVGRVHFGSKTSHLYREQMELPFFRHFLKDASGPDLPEAWMFDTGAHEWRRFDAWPPARSSARSLYCVAGGALSPEPPQRGDTPQFRRGIEECPQYDEYVSDPRKPVPFTEAIALNMTDAYMTDDQRFAARRPDVLVYQTAPLEEPLTLAGPITADLWVSTSGTDSDFVVKLIDVLPDAAPERMGGYQMMVRSEVFRGRFRESPEHPKAFTPHWPTSVRFDLQDVLHTFKSGHRIMVQIQSTWFPLVDRNPQTFVENIFLAEPEDFVKATQRVHRSPHHATRLVVGVLE